MFIDTSLICLKQLKKRRMMKKSKTHALLVVCFWNKDPVDDVHALFQFLKHRSYKGVKPSPTPLSLRSSSFFSKKYKTLNLNQGQGSLQIVRPSAQLSGIPSEDQSYLRSHNKEEEHNPQWMSLTH